MWVLLLQRGCFLSRVSNELPQAIDHTRCGHTREAHSKPNCQEDIHIITRPVPSIAIGVICA